MTLAEAAGRSVAGVLVTLRLLHRLSERARSAARAALRLLRPGPREPAQLPTPPHQLFVGRAAAIAAVEPVMKVAGPLLRDCVDEGARIFLATQEGTKTLGVDVAIAPLRLFHKVLESADAAELLLSAGNGRAAAAPARSCFETAAELMFMHRLGPRFSEGALAWYATKLKRRRAFFDRARKLDHDHKPFVKAATERIAGLDRILATPHMAAVTAKHDDTPWYRHFGGSKQIPNLEVLVQFLEGPSEDRVFRRGYALLFVPYSESSHASDHDAFFEVKDGRILLRPIRQPDDTRELATVTVSMCLGAIFAVAERLRPDLLPELRQWYVQRVQAPYLSLRPE